MEEKRTQNIDRAKLGHCFRTERKEQPLADITSNVNQAISDFNAIQSAIEEAGVPAGNTPTAQYPDKIALIPGIPAKIIDSPQGRTYIKNIVVPQDVTILADYAFAGDGQLRSVELPAGLVTIGINAFNGCTRLTDIQLPAGMKTVNNYAFYGCENLQEITFPESLTTLGTASFKGSKIKSAQLPDSVTTIGVSCFEDCTALESAKLPAAIARIPSKMFWGCTSLPEITIPDNVTTIDGYAFYDCAKLKNILFPAGLASIGLYAFKGTGLESAVIPHGTQIGRNCFSECANLIAVTLPDDLTVLPQAIFQNCSSLRDIALPDGLTQMQTNAFYGTASLETLVFPATLKSIGTSAFAGSGITEVILPEGLESIGASAFYDCKNLKKLYLPATLNTAPVTYIVQDEVSLGKGYHLNLDIAYSTNYSVQMLLDCIYNFEGRSGMESLTFKIGSTNLKKLDGVYVLETADGLDIVTETAPGAVLAKDYAKNKNISLQ